MNNKTWTTRQRYVDLETGELLPKKRIDNGEYVILRHKSHKLITTHYGIYTITYECERNRQQKLF